MRRAYFNVPIIIPALNPDDRLLVFINELRQVGFSQIILVDDGSDEEYKNSIFKKAYGISAVKKVLTFDENQGKGSACKMGFAYVYENMPDAIGVITADYDGKQSADNVAMVANKLLEGHKFVLGCRDVLGSNVKVGIKRMHKFLRMAFKLLYDQQVDDIQSGLRGIAYQLLPMMLEIKGSRYEYDTKMIIDVVRANIKVEQVKVGRITPINASSEEIVKSENYRPIKDSVLIIISLFLNFIGYSMSSIIATSVDFAIFYLLSNFVFDSFSTSVCVLLATVLARVISVSISFNINRNVVFKSKDKFGKTMIMYYGLAAIIMLLSAGLVTLFVTLFGGGKTFTKLFVDFVLFFLSYQIQQRVIFNNTTKVKENV